MENSQRSYYFGAKGQKLSVHEWGTTDKPVILLVHGFPGCAEHAKLMSGTPFWNSFRLISMDRPGYGKSDVQKKITPIKFAQQVQSLLDEKKIDTFSIISVSGGAPYSFAIAHLLPQRVQKVSCVAGIAPISFSNFFYMNSQQKKAWALQKIVPRLLLNYALHSVWQKGIDKMDKLLFTKMDAFSEFDQKVFSDPQIGPELISTMKAALQNGPGGVIDDMRVYGKHWGFDLAQVSCPVTLWHGNRDDVVHQRFSKEMRRQLPKAKLKIKMNEGHYSLLMNYRDSIIQDALNL